MTSEALWHQWHSKRWYVRKIGCVVSLSMLNLILLSWPNWRKVPKWTCISVISMTMQNLCYLLDHAIFLLLFVGVGALRLDDNGVISIDWSSCVELEWKLVQVAAWSDEVCVCHQSCVEPILHYVELWLCWTCWTLAVLNLLVLEFIVLVLNLCTRISYELVMEFIIFMLLFQNFFMLLYWTCTKCLY